MLGVRSNRDARRSKFGSCRCSRTTSRRTAGLRLSVCTNRRSRRSTRRASTGSSRKPATWRTTCPMRLRAGRSGAPRSTQIARVSFRLNYLQSIILSVEVVYPNKIRTISSNLSFGKVLRCCCTRLFWKRNGQAGFLRKTSGYPQAHGRTE